MTTENKHCGKHDKIYSDDKPCPGCETEKAALEAPEGQEPQVSPAHGEEGHEHVEGDEEEKKT